MDSDGWGWEQMLGPSEHGCRPSNLHDTLEEDQEIIKAGGVRI